jgi:Mg/Co/Ni transporter MgtE
MSNSLQHYGILGMKWGVRRNPAQLGYVTVRQANKNARKAMKEARLNSIAKDRASSKYVTVRQANKNARKAMEEARRNSIAKDKEKNRTLREVNKKAKSKNVKEMSDDELRKVVNRLQMERQYSQLSEGSVSKGKEYTQKIIKAGTTVAAVTTTALTIYNNAEKIKAILEKTKK